MHPFTEPEWHTLLRQPSALSAQRKGGGISKGGNLGSPLWLRAEGTPWIKLSPQKNQTRHTDSYHKWSAATTTIIHYSFFTIHLFRSPFDPVPEARPAQSYRFIINRPDTHRLPRQHSTLFTAAPREYIHARPSECKRATTRTRVQRHAASVRSTQFINPGADFQGK